MAGSEPQAAAGRRGGRLPTFARRLLAALATLALLALASWLPLRLGVAPSARGVLGAARPATPSATPAAGAPPAAPDIGRPALPVPRDIPAHPAGPVAAVRDFFFTLACAADVPADGPPVGCGQAAYPRAYAYLDPAWQARLPFAQFVQQQAGVLHTDLLLAVDAGPVPGNPRERRVFAEVRRLERAGERQVVAFWSGVFVANAGPRGWTLLAGQLQPEDLAAIAYARSDLWRTDPVAVARVALGLPAAATVAPLGEQRSGLLATVSLRPPGAERAARVHLVQRVDGAWQALWVDRG